jgi:hypothetical protein
MLRQAGSPHSRGDRTDLGLPHRPFTRGGLAAGFRPAERPTFSAPNPDCEARFTIDSHGVRGIAYTTTAGKPLPLGETCEIGVRQCVGYGL